MAEPATFNPRDHLRTLRGNSQYLDVKYRLLWLRQEHPDAKIRTEHIRLDDAGAIFRATVILTSGAEGSGYGSETPGDFGDYIEKAETKAIGRALETLGYGTAAAADDPEGSLANVPIQRPAPVQNTAQRPRTAPAPAAAPNRPPTPPRAAEAATGPSKPSTSMQRLHGHANGRKLTPDDVHALAVHWYGVSSRTELNAQQINGMIAAFDLSSDQALDDETLATEIVKAYEAVDARKASAPAPGSPEDLAAINAIVATPSTASDPDQHLDWTENQLRWKKAIDEAVSDRQFVAIEASIPKDKHGSPDRMLTDYLAVKREQFANRAQ